MIARPDVLRDINNKTIWARLSGYVASATVAGAFWGAILALLGGSFSAPTRAAATALAGSLALVAGLLEYRFDRFRPLQCDRETPKRWSRYGGLRWALRNGWSLGFGARSRLGFFLWYLIPCGCFVVGDPLAGSMIWGTYGLIRSGAVLLLLGQDDDAGASISVSSRLTGRFAAARRVSGIAMFGIGAILVTRVGW